MFHRCGSRASSIPVFCPGKTILVPLTNSLYVPGKLSDPENVIVDIGTGYYVKKVGAMVQVLGGCNIIRPQNRSQALKHYETKVDFIRTNLETLQDTIQKKQDNLNYLLSIIQSKLQVQTQASQA